MTITISIFQFCSKSEHKQVKRKKLNGTVFYLIYKVVQNLNDFLKFIP